MKAAYVKIIIDLFLYASVAVAWIFVIYAGYKSGERELQYL